MILFLLYPVLNKILDPHLIPKFNHSLPNIPIFYIEEIVKQGHTQSRIKIDSKKIYQQILPDSFPSTQVLAFGGKVLDPINSSFIGLNYSVPGPTIKVRKNQEVVVQWKNSLVGQHLTPIDYTLQVPQAAIEQIPMVPHLHGGETESKYDGTPSSWFTKNGKHGKDYHTLQEDKQDSSVYVYKNKQSEAILWYHDHTLGITRNNVYSGLAGFYLIQDRLKTFVLPSKQYQIDLCIQDKSFHQNGSLFYDVAQEKKKMYHPIWVPQFYGNVNVVNGKAWPFKKVDRGWYRIRILIASNSRYYNLTFWDSKNPINFTLIGSQGGFLQKAVNLTSILLSSAQRADILLNFNMTNQDQIILKNSASYPFPSGQKPDPQTDGVVMRFNIRNISGVQTVSLPTYLNPTLQKNYFPTIIPQDKRILTLVQDLRFDQEGQQYSIGLYLNGQPCNGFTTQIFVEGSTTQLIIVNPTQDAHPIHVHLVHMQLSYRIPIKSRYQRDFLELNGNQSLPYEKSYVPISLGIEGYIDGQKKQNIPKQRGWKDTISINPNQAISVFIRVMSIQGNKYPFSINQKPPYVWHCHMVQHQDNQMMRPLQFVEMVSLRSINSYLFLSTGLKAESISVMIQGVPLPQLDKVQLNTHWYVYKMAADVSGQSKVVKYSIYMNVQQPGYQGQDIIDVYELRYQWILLGTVISFIWMFFYMSERSIQHPPATHLLCLLSSISQPLSLYLLSLTTIFFKIIHQMFYSSLQLNEMSIGIMDRQVLGLIDMSIIIVILLMGMMCSKYRHMLFKMVIMTSVVGAMQKYYNIFIVLLINLYVLYKYYPSNQYNTLYRNYYLLDSAFLLLRRTILMTLFNHPNDAFYLMLILASLEIGFSIKEFNLRKHQSMLVNLMNIRIDGMVVVVYIVMVVYKCNILVVGCFSIMHVIFQMVKMGVQYRGEKEEEEVKEMKLPLG